MHRENIMIDEPGKGTHESIVGIDNPPEQSDAIDPTTFPMEPEPRFEIRRGSIRVSTATKKVVAWVVVSTIIVFIFGQLAFKCLDRYIPDVYPSRTFLERSQPYALALVFIFPTLLAISEYYLLYQSTKSTREKGSLFYTYDTIFNVVLVLVSFYLALSITNMAITRTAVTVFHLTADKARVEFTATVQESDAQNRFSFITGCFRKVKITTANFESDWNTICVTKGDYQLLLDGRLPERVKFQGYKSDYGYEIWPIEVMGSVWPQ